MDKTTEQSIRLSKLNLELAEAEISYSWIKKSLDSPKLNSAQFNHEISAIQKCVRNAYKELTALWLEDCPMTVELIESINRCNKLCFKLAEIL